MRRALERKASFDLVILKHLARLVRLIEYSEKFVSEILRFYIKIVEVQVLYSEHFPSDNVSELN